MTQYLVLYMRFFFTSSKKLYKIWTWASDYISSFSHCFEWPAGCLVSLISRKTYFQFGITFVSSYITTYLSAVHSSLIAESNCLRRGFVKITCSVCMVGGSGSTWSFPLSQLIHDDIGWAFVICSRHLTYSYRWGHLTLIYCWWPYLIYCWWPYLAMSACRSSFSGTFPL